MPLKKTNEHTVKPTKTASLCGHLMILAAVTIWGGSFASTKYALIQAEAMVIICLRFAVGVLVLFAGLVYEKSFRLPTSKEAILFFFIGFQGIFFHQAIQSYALKTAGAANSNWMMIATPAVVAILGRLFLGEKISTRGIFGMTLAASGVALVVARGTLSAAGPENFGSVGDLIMLFSVLNWAVFLIITRKTLKTDLSPTFVIFWELFFALISSVFFACLIGSDFSVISDFTSGMWLALIFLGAFSSAMAYLFWFKALAIFTVARVAVFQFFQPIAGIIISYFLIGERFTLWLVVGGAMILYGVWLVDRK